MHACIHVYVYIYYLYIHVCTQIHLYIYMYIYIYIFIHLLHIKPRHVHTHTDSAVQRIGLMPPLNIYIYTHTYIHNTCIHILHVIPTCAHTHPAPQHMTQSHACTHPSALDHPHTRKSTHQMPVLIPPLPLSLTPAVQHIRRPHARDHVDRVCLGGVWCVCLLHHGREG